jgi:hypothetical protein
MWLCAEAEEGDGDSSGMDADGDDEGDEAELAQMAGVSLGASDADAAGALKPPPTAYTALQVGP